MDNKFPQALYKAPGIEDIHGGKFSSCAVGDDVELRAALAAGWSETTTEALANFEASKQADKVSQEASKQKQVEAEKAALAAGARATLAADSVSRQDLEALAVGFGLRFDGRTGDKKLRAMIDAQVALVDAEQASE